MKRGHEKVTREEEDFLRKHLPKPMVDSMVESGKPPGKGRLNFSKALAEGNLAEAEEVIDKSFYDLVFSTLREKPGLEQAKITIVISEPFGKEKSRLLLLGDAVGWSEAAKTSDNATLAYAHFLEAAMELHGGLDGLIDGLTKYRDHKNNKQPPKWAQDMLAEIEKDK